MGTLDYRVYFRQVPDYASHIKQRMDFFTMIIVGEGWEHWTIGEVWERWTIWEGVGTLDYRVCFTSGPRLC